jgi:hypothetical protein
VQKRTTLDPSPPVSPTPTLSRGRLVPPTAMGSLFTRKRASRSPWVSCRGTVPFRQLHLLRSFTPSSESVRDWLGFPLTRRPILSWDSAPLELSPPTPRILDPSRPEGLNTNSCLAARDSKDRSPTCRVRPSRSPKEPVRPLDGFQPPYEAGPHRLSAASPSPLTLGRRASPLPLAFGASKCVASGVSPQRSPSLLGFGTSSPTS